MTILKILSLLQFVFLVWAQGPPTLAPPSTFPALTTGSLSTSTLPSTPTSSGNSTTTLSTTTSAQFPSLSGYSACVSNCLATGIARVGCGSVTDVECFCIKPQFTIELVGCVQSNCPTELQTLENLAQQFCNVASHSPSLSFPPAPSTTTTPPTTTSNTSTTSTPSITSTSTSAATLNSMHVGREMLTSVVMTVLGLVAGACAL